MLSFYLSMLKYDGDKELFTQIFYEHNDKFFRVALRYLSYEDAQDCLQISYMKILSDFEKLKSIPCEKRPRYIVIVVGNTAKNMLKSERSNVPLNEELEVPVVTPGPEDFLKTQYIIDLINVLPETYRDVLEMRLIIGFTEPEIAEILGITLTNVSSRYSRGRNLLKELYLKEELDYDGSRV